MFTALPYSNCSDNTVKAISRKSKQENRWTPNSVTNGSEIVNTNFSLYLLSGRTNASTTNGIAFSNISLKSELNLYFRGLFEIDFNTDGRNDRHENDVTDHFIVTIVQNWANLSDPNRRYSDSQFIEVYRMAAKKKYINWKSNNLLVFLFENRITVTQTVLLFQDFFSFLYKQKNVTKKTKTKSKIQFIKNKILIIIYVKWSELMYLIVNERNGYRVGYLLNEW